MKQNNQLWLLLAVIAIFVVMTHGTKQADNSDYLSATEDFAFTPALSTLAASLKTTDQMNTARNVLRYVNENIKYKDDVQISYCYTETAQTVLDSKQGDCVSMTRLAVTLLRINGIETRSVGGCVTFDSSCDALFAIVPEPFMIPKSSLADGKKRGYLHEWSEAKINGVWYIVEATNGKLYPDTCDNYHAFKYDTNKYDRCVIDDKTFVEQCKVK